MRHETDIIAASGSLAKFFGSALPSVPSMHLDLINAAATRRPRWEVESEGARVVVSWTSEVPDTKALSLSIPIETAAGLVITRCAPEFIEALFADQVNFGANEPAFITLLARHLVSSSIKIDGTELGVSLAPSAPETVAGTGHLPFAFSVMIEGQKTPHFVTLEAEAGLLRRILPPTSSKPTDIRRLAVTLNASMRSEEKSVLAEDLQSLAIGDLLYLAGPTAATFARGLCLGGIWRAGLEPAEAGFRVIDLVDVKDTNKRTFDMTQTTLNGRNLGATVPLSVEFGRKSLTLDEVANLTDGSIIDFGSVSHDDVTLRAGEKAVARGMLVEIGGGVGLKITAVY
jgi:flagellar motor switch/type III secretory pathway protein FliN